MANIEVNYSDLSTDEENESNDEDIEISSMNYNDDVSDEEDVPSDEDDTISLPTEMIKNLSRLSEVSSYSHSKEFPLSSKQKASILLKNVDVAVNEVGQLEPYQYHPGADKLTPVINTEIANDILTHLPGINVLGVSSYINDDKIDLNDLIIIDINETLSDFEARRRLTLQLANIPDFPLNNVAVVVASKMIMKKITLGIVYSDDVERVLEHLLSLVQ